MDLRERRLDGNVMRGRQDMNSINPLPDFGSKLTWLIYLRIACQTGKLFTTTRLLGENPIEKGVLILCSCEENHLNL